jgi:hypothetical protein
MHRKYDTSIDCRGIAAGTVRWSVAAACALLVAAGGARAQEANQGVPGDWLSRYTGARTLGLGGAFVAAADETQAALWNPAGLTQLFQNEAHFENARMFESTSINSYSFALPARKLPSFGLTIVSLSSGEFERTNELNESLGSFDESQTAFIFSAAKSVSRRLSLGANLKVVRHSLEEFSAGGTGADVGVLFSATPKIRLGASLLNLGGPNIKLRDVEEPYPVEMRGGLSVRVLDGKGLISGEVDHREGPGTALRAGAEYWLMKNLGLRVGYDDVSAVGGFSYRFPHGLRLDYGVGGHELGTTHRFGVSYRFGGFFADSQAEPEIFSPTGQNPVTKFNLKARTKAEPREWRLDIVNKSDEVVRTFGGRGMAPAHVLWDGKDATGLPLADGAYRYRLVVLDQLGDAVEAREHTVEISTGGPQGTVPVVIE